MAIAEENKYRFKGVSVGISQCPRLLGTFGFRRLVGRIPAQTCLAVISPD
jgi:hypothetical protein